MRICSWNVRRASRKSSVWNYLSEMDPDIALLQEVGSIPESLAARYRAVSRHPITKNGTPQRFKTAILARGDLTEAIQLNSNWGWVNSELERYSGNILAHGVVVGGKEYSVVSAYSPAWPIDPQRLKGIDVTPVKLQNNPKVWTTEILWAALLHTIKGKGNWIVGGDLNSSETFDYLWKGGPRGNKEILDRFDALGFIECLRKYSGRLVPTFRNPSDGKVIHQMDHLFVNNELGGQLEFCKTGEPEVVFANSLSDHLPIIADFTI
jgi:exonuclease III